MTSIQKLRSQVDKADQRLGATAAQARKYAQRLTKLLDRVEDEHEGRRVRTERLHLENDELRAMLHSLSIAVEQGGGDTMEAVLHEVEARIAALVETAPDVEAAVPPALAEASADTDVASDPMAEADDDEAPATGDPRTIAEAVDRLMEVVSSEPGGYTPGQLLAVGRQSPAIAAALDELRAVFLEDGDPAQDADESVPGDVAADPPSDVPQVSPEPLTVVEGEQPAPDGGDPGIRRILEHVREEIEANQEPADPAVGEPAVGQSRSAAE